MSRSILLAVFLCTCSVTLSVKADNWPAWRGPTGDGVCRETNLPIVWNKTQGILWSTPLAEWGDSTPIIWNDAIFLTTHAEDKLLLLKLNKQTGTVEWTQEVATGDAARMPLRKKEKNERSEQKFHELHNLATPSPVTDGKTVVVHFGNGILAAYNFDGKQLWKHDLQSEYGQYSIWWGHANSPVISGGLVISVCMQDSLADLQPDNPSASYVVAHELQTGKERWKTMRMTKAAAEECDAYTTPLVVDFDGKRQIIVMGGNQLDSYDAADGKQLWSLPGLVGGRTVTSPTVADGLVIATRGMRGSLFALPLEKTLSSKSRELDFRDLAWKYDQGTPDSCSPVAWGEGLFTIADDGIARAFDLHTGNQKWKQRLKDKYKASPVVAEGRIYFLNMAGLCTVVAASDRFDKIAENQIDDQFLASPAISDGRIYLRGRKALYAIGK